MSFSHLIILGILIIVFVPADKLPELARNLGRMLNEIRRSTSGVWDDLKKEAQLRPEDLKRHLESKDNQNNSNEDKSNV